MRPACAASSATSLSPSPPLSSRQCLLPPFALAVECSCGVVGVVVGLSVAVLLLFRSGASLVLLRWWSSPVTVALHVLQWLFT
eukprot:3886154-Rhodomonas_salina.1